MATWDDVARACRELPEAVEQISDEGLRQWRVRDKLFAWERPMRKADLAELGPAAPSGPALAVRVPDVGAKAALIADDPAVYFTTAHFDGYPAVLVHLERLEDDELRELVAEGWACRAPRRLVAQRGAPPS